MLLPQVLGNIAACDAIFETSGHEEILALLKLAMEQYYRHEGVMQAVCKGLANITSSNGNGRAVIKHGFLGLLKHVMEEHRDNMEIFDVACEALHSIQL